MTSTWKVDPSVSTYPDSSFGDHSSLNVNILQDKVGAFLCSQLGFARANSAAFMALPSPGVDIPFENFQSPSFNAFIRRRGYSISLQNNKTSGTPIEFLTSTPDDIPRFIASSGFPKENAIINFQEKERWKWALSNEKNAFSMFPALIPATSFSTISCNLFSEIQRHMLEPTIDGGLTWSPLWTKSEVQGYFNERIERFYLQTGVIQEEFSVGITSGLSEYNYPSDLIQAKRLSFLENSSLYNGLISFWRLGENSGNRLDSIDSNNLTPVNNPTQVAGKIGNAVGLSSTNNQFLYSTTTTLNPGLGDFSIAGWIYPTNISGNASYTIIGKGVSNFPGPQAIGYNINLEGTGTAYPGLIHVDFGSLPSGVGTGDLGLFYTFDFAPPLNTWSHFVILFNRDGDCTGFFNNEIGGPFTGPPSFNGLAGMNRLANTQGDCQPPASFGVGTVSQNNIIPPVGDQPFDGRIDAIGYWNRLLTRNEISELWNGGDGIELYPWALLPGMTSVLSRVDPFTQDNGDPGWQLETGTPSTIIEEPRSPLSFQLAPTPDINGSVEGIYVADPSPIGDACIPLPIPNFMTWGLKYGVMADMLNKEGEAHDPERGKYCENRYQECIQLTRALLGFNDPDQDNSQQKGGQ